MTLFPVTSPSPLLQDFFRKADIIGARLNGTRPTVSPDLLIPPDTTSQIQPLDLGIIQNFKIHYRKLLLRFVLSKIDDTNDTAWQIVKSISVLMAIRWVAEAWDSVQEETIRNALQSPELLGPVSLLFIDYNYEDEDPFDDVEAQEELHELLDRISPSDTNCPVEEYIDREGDVPTNWEDHFFANLGSSQAVSDSLVQEDPDDEEGQFDLATPPPKITRFQDAISSLEEVQSFLDWRGFSEEAITTASSMNKLTYFHCESLNSARQTTFDDYFHPIYI